MTFYIKIKFDSDKSLHDPDHQKLLDEIGSALMRHNIDARILEFYEETLMHKLGFKGRTVHIRTSIDSK